MDEPLETLSPIQLQITAQISRAFARLGADLTMIAAVNSWGDTLPESDVLSLLKERNDAMEKA